MTDRFEARLSEYVDGELGAEETALLERHLPGCEDCTRTLEELRRVAARAAELPPREPPEAVWTGISARIGEGRERAEMSADGVSTGGSTGGIARRRISFSPPQLAAAAAIVAALSGGLAWVLSSPAPSGSEARTAAGASPATAGRAVSTYEATGMAEYYAGAIAALESAIFDPARPLPAETEARIRRALATIDRALEDARRALEEAPDDPYLLDHVTETMRRKSEFLRRAVKIAAQS